MNKKGQLLNIADNIRNVFILVIVLIIVAVFLYNFSNTLNANNYATDESKTIAYKFYNNLCIYGDYIILIMIIGLLMASCFQAYKSFSNPFMAWITIILLILLPFFSMILANIYGKFIESSNIAVVVVNMPITNYIMNHFAIVTVIEIVIIALFYFYKGQENVEVLT